MSTQHADDDHQRAGPTGDPASPAGDRQNLNHPAVVLIPRLPTPVAG